MEAKYYEELCIMKIDLGKKPEYSKNWSNYIKEHNGINKIKETDTNIDNNTKQFLSTQMGRIENTVLTNVDMGLYWGYDCSTHKYQDFLFLQEPSDQDESYRGSYLLVLRSQDLQDRQIDRIVNRSELDIGILHG